MAGTKDGGIKARDTNTSLYGADYYPRIGRSGGLARVPKGFSKNRKLARKVGGIGGSISSRGTKPRLTPEQRRAIYSKYGIVDDAITKKSRTPLKSSV